MCMPQRLVYRGVFRRNELDVGLCLSNLVLGWYNGQRSCLANDFIRSFDYQGFECKISISFDLKYSCPYMLSRFNYWVLVHRSGSKLHQRRIESNGIAAYIMNYFYSERWKGQRLISSYSSSNDKWVFVYRDCQE